MKSALVSTGSPVVVGRARREVSPTREGGGMIWLPRADQPLVFARPASFSLGLLRRGSDLSSYFLGSDLTDAGGGAGVWQASVRPLASVRGAAVRVAATVNVPGKLTLGVDVARSARAGEGSGFVLLTRGGQTRRFPYWFRVSVPRLGGEGHTLLRRPGLYRGNTRGRPARVSSYRYPSAPGPLGVTQRLAGPEQVFRFVIHGRVENAGAVVVSEGPGSHVSPRLVRAGSEDRLAGYTALPLRLNPYRPNFFAVIPAVGVFRPAPGPYDLVFDTTSRRAAGPFAFRFWVNDTSPPAVDPSTLLAIVDGSFHRVVWDKAHGLVAVRIPTLGRGSHKLVFTVSDYQEAKNNENAGTTLPNTRRLSATFSVR